MEWRVPRRQRDRLVPAVGRIRHGTLSFGGDDYAITGTLDEFGIFALGGSSTAAGTCLTVNSAIDDLALSELNMEGVVQRHDPGDCSGGGATLVQQGLMTLDKVTS